MSALIPALIQLLMSGRGRGGGGGGGGRRGGGGGRGGSGRSGGRGRKPFDPEEDLNRKAEQRMTGGRRNPFDPNTIYTRQDQGVWDNIYKQLQGEMEYPEPDIPDDIYDYEE